MSHDFGAVEAVANVSKVLQEALEDIIEEQTKRCLRCGRSLSNE